MTPEQQRRKADARNAQRRLRYARDRAYRVHVNRGNRQRYRRRQGVHNRDCTKRLPLLHTWGRTRTIYDRDVLDPKVREVTTLTFTTKELASILGYHYVVITQWQRQSKLPRPQHWTTDPLPYPVYLMPEVEGMVKVMGAHQRQSQLLCSSDRETITALFQCVPERGLVNPATRFKQQRLSAEKTNTSKHHGKESSSKNGGRKVHQAGPRHRHP